MRNNALARIFMMAGLMGLFGCNQSPSTSSAPPSNGAADSSTGNSASSSEQQPAAPPFAPKPIVVQSGTPISVTVDQTVSSKTSNEGDHFDASLAAPVTVGERVVIPSGARARGTVTVAKSAGKFKGNAELGVTLDSITVNGERYSVRTTSVTEAGKGRGKRTAIGAGGGAVVGGLIGALAGGGKGAAIGAGAGAGAGTAGAAFTGDRDITIQPETKLSFRLEKPVEIKRK
ncbi:MAG: hypothetical protein JWN92_1366 [Candidatus Acidoferrum typicum]|nr:hypothetical protein [Candidatus Acidoferrum typicum]